MDTDPLQPAFPRDHRHAGHNGMTLRDWFAGQAMVVLNTRDRVYAVDAAREAYKIADALLAERVRS